MNIEQVKKLLAPSNGFDPFTIDAYTVDEMYMCIHDIATRMSGVEDTKLTLYEFEQLLIRLCPNVAPMFPAHIGIPRILPIVIEHVFTMARGMRTTSLVSGIRRSTWRTKVCWI